MDYHKLFAEYEEMGVDYGTIKYCCRNTAETLESAREALEAYENGNYHFELAGVAQGNTVAEYARSYKSQRCMGLGIVVLGGLLGKTENPAGMAGAKNGTFLKNALHAIRALYPDDKLFPLWASNKRIAEIFKSENIWASDCGEWAFKDNKAGADALGDRLQQTAEDIRNLIRYANENTGPNPSRQKKVNPRLLLVSCTRKKSSAPRKAINVYDGPYFRVIRKRCSPDADIDINIISAKYGLLDADDEISPYDHEMTAKDAKIYKQAYEKYLGELFSEYSTVTFCGSKLYASVLPETNAYIIKGRRGIQLHLLKEWLCNNGQPALAQE